METIADPFVVVIGAGAMGGTMAAALVRGGARVVIVDTDAAHVSTINDEGLRVHGLSKHEDAMSLKVPANCVAPGAAVADLAVVMTPAFETSAAAQTAAAVLKPGGSAVSLQNGLGNAEALIDVLGHERVFMGSTRASADRPALGCPRVTKMDPTKVGELNGQTSERATWLAACFDRGGMPSSVTENIQGVLWSKFIHNCCINALSAITGLRMGEVTRIPDLGALRYAISDEALAVARANGIRLEHPDPLPKMEIHVWRKFTKPSMLQHVDQGRMIEIDAINGWLVREATRLGLSVPVNQVVTALARGRAQAQIIASGPTPDYAALTATAEAEIDRGDRPWERLSKEERA
ncbi:MAG: 2-dehydropantoate 2-reductase [Pseudomonadota bacterium]